MSHCESEGGVYTEERLVGSRGVAVVPSDPSVRILSYNEWLHVCNTRVQSVHFLLSPCIEFGSKSSAMLSVHEAVFFRTDPIKLSEAYPTEQSKLLHASNALKAMGTLTQPI